MSGCPTCVEDNGSETASPHPVPCQKDVWRGVRRRDRGQLPQLQKNRGARATTLGPQIRNDYAEKLTSQRGHVRGLQNKGHPQSQVAAIGWVVIEWVSHIRCERFSLTNGGGAVTTWDAELYLAWNDRDGRDGGRGDGPVD
jgi:hypothetical protein